MQTQRPLAMVALLILPQCLLMVTMPLVPSPLVPTLLPHPPTVTPPLSRPLAMALPLAMPTLCPPVAVLLREILLQSKETMLPMTSTIPTTSRSETLSCLLTRLF